MAKRRFFWGVMVCWGNAIPGRGRTGKAKTRRKAGVKRLNGMRSVSLNPAGTVSYSYQTMRPIKSVAKTTRVTLKDIAKAAGVSVMTVSYAMRGSAEVSEKQRKRIQDIA